MQKSFPYNPTLIAMDYTNEILSVTFRKPKLAAGIQVRSYANVPKELVYQWYYKSTVTDILSFYAKNIRKKYDLLTVK